MALNLSDPEARKRAAHEIVRQAPDDPLNKYVDRPMVGNSDVRLGFPLASKEALARAIMLAQAEFDVILRELQAPGVTERQALLTARYAIRDLDQRIHAHRRPRHGHHQD